MKSLVLIFTLVFTGTLSFTQQELNEKKAKKFGKKTVLYMNYEDMSKFMPDEEQQKIIAEKTGKDPAAYKKEVAKNLKKINNDVKFLNENGIARILDDVEIDLIQKEPIIKANLILKCHYKDKHYKLILENCYQVGKKDWVFGNAVTPKGEDIQDLIDRNKEKEVAAENKEKGKLEQWVEKTEQESQEEKERKGKRYVGKKFQLQSGQPHSVFYRVGSIGEKLNGYYVTKDLEKHEGKILYQAPEIMHDPNKYLVTYDEKGTMREWSKGELEAFYVADQLYIFTGEFWDIMIEEGAIRKLGRVVKNNSTGEYVTADLIQKVGLSPENVASLTLGFKNKMSDLVSENESLSAKIKNKEKGYRLMQLDDIIEEYNYWYDEKGPADIEYLAVKIEKAKTKKNEASAEVVEDGGAADNPYTAMNDMEIKKEYQIAIQKGMLGIVLDMIQKDDRITASSGTPGTMPPILVAMQYGQSKIAKLLISQGADVSATDHAGRTALHFAVAPNSGAYDSGLIEKLINSGADVNAQDDKGRTPLHMMAVQANKYSIEKFLKHNPDKSIKNEKGETALDVAKKYSNDSKVHELLTP